MGILREIVSGFGPGEWALMLGTIITGAVTLGAAFIHIYPQLKKLEQKNVDNQTPDTNDEGDDSVSGTEQEKSPRCKAKFSTKAWFLFFSSLLLLSTVIFGALQCLKKETPPNQPVIIDTTNSKKQVLEAQATNVATIETPPKPKTGDVREFALTEDVKLEMVYCPAGTFTMGSPEEELGRGFGETPHEVTLTKGFWIGQYPVTQIQYKAITGENPAEKDYGVGDNNPIYNVSWHDSVAFCEKLNQLRIAPAGYRFELPTEAQWEYACRAGTTTALNNGKPITSEDGKCRNLDEVGWYSKNSDSKTHLVGQKQPNAWGIYDMHGNVWEWCRDCCSTEEVDDFWLTVTTDTYKDGIVDPLCETGGRRVLRGGSWGGNAGDCRSAYRDGVAPGGRSYSYGFRLALIPVKAGDVQTITLPGGVSLEMVYCPGGRFTMGSPDGESEYPMGSGVDPKAELGRSNDETPHEVRLTKGYWIGQYPVTQIQYAAITGRNPSYFEGDTRPVERVSWHDCVAFCEKLNQLKIAPSGYRFALPTEAQWEYACRAGTGTTTALNNGKPITSERGKCRNLDEVGWYSGNSTWETHPVMEKKANAWGIYDMHGNVWEWCIDYCDWTKEKGTITDTYRDGIVDPLCKKGGIRVLRGGSWFSNARGCRSAYRSCYAPDRRGCNYGFRLALVPE